MLKAWVNRKDQELFYINNTQNNTDLLIQVKGLVYHVENGIGKEDGSEIETI